MESPIVFQAITWKDLHEPIYGSKTNDDNDPLYDDLMETFKDGIYTIFCFGKMKSGELITVKITDFKPHFYMTTTSWLEGFSKTDILQIEEAMTDLLENGRNTRYINPIHSIKLEKKLITDRFTNLNPKKMLKVSMNNANAIRDLKFPLKKYGLNLGLRGKNWFNLYDSHIEPMLKLFHQKDLKPCGWLEIIPSKLKKIHNHYVASVSWKKIKNYTKKESENLTNNDFVVLSFDLECVPDDGINFPIATKPNDQIIQIGLSFKRHNHKKPFKDYILTLKSCGKYKIKEVKE